MKNTFMTTLTVIVLSLYACGGAPERQQDHSHHPTLKANLPISAERWTAWRCPDGSTLRTRYSDRRGDELQLEIAGNHHRLKHDAGLNPAIYSNHQIAFFSDGQYAAIGRPLSDVVQIGGCISVP